MDLTAADFSEDVGRAPKGDPSVPPYVAEEERHARVREQGDELEVEYAGLVTMWADRAEASETAQLPFHVEARALTAYDQGFQHLIENSVSTPSSAGYAIKVKPKAFPWEVRVTANYYSQFLGTRVAMMLSDLPTPQALASNDSDESRTHADIATQLLKYYDYKIGMVSLLELLEGSRCNVGVAFIVDGWDPDGWAETLEPGGEVVVRQVGTMTTEVVPVWEVFWQPGKPASRSDWYIRRQRMTLKQVREAFGERGSLVAESDGNAGGEGASTEESSLDAALLQGVGRQAVGVAEPGAQFVDVFEGYERVPGRAQRDQWQKLTWCGQVVLDEETCNWQPVVPVIYREALGYVYPVGMGRDMRDLQDRINRRKGLNEEHLNREQNPPLLKKLGTVVAEGTLTGEPGEVIEWAGEEAPRYLEVPRMTPEAAAAPDGWANDMRAVTGIHHVTQADLPQQSMSGRAVEALQSQALGNSAFAVRNFHTALSIHYRNVVVIHREHCSEERWIAIEGTDQAGDVEAFIADDLLGVEQVRFGVTSGLPMTPGERFQRIVAMQAMGLMQPGREQELDDVTKYLKIGEIRKEPTLYTLGEQGARREQRQLKARRVMAPVTIWEPAKAHLETHRKYLVSEEFKRLDEWQQAEFVKHYKITELVVRAQGMTASAEEALMAAGTLGLAQGADGALAMAQGPDGVWGQPGAGAEAGSGPSVAALSGPGQMGPMGQAKQVMGMGGAGGAPITPGQGGA